MEDERKENDIVSSPSRDYLNLRYNQQKDEIHGTSRGKVAEFYHYFYQRYNKEWNPREAIVLEFGGGPSILPFISAAPVVSSMVFSEYGEMRKAVEIWKDNNPNAFNWINYSRYIVEDLEGSKDPDAARERLEEVRSKMNHIISCDFNRDNVVPQVAIPSEGFDIITFTYVLECCVDTEDAMVLGLKRLKRILKPGGFIAGILAENMVSWKEPYSGKADCFTVTDKSQVGKIFESAGFSVTEHKYHRHVPNHLFSSTRSQEIIARNFN